MRMKEAGRKRQGWHAGTIEELDNGRFRWRVWVAYPDGTRARPGGTTRTKTEARAAIIAAQQEAKAGQRPVSERLTVGEMVTEYMQAKRATWAEKTAFNNEALYSRHVAPHLAHLRAAGVTPARLREYFALLSTKRPRPGGEPGKDFYMPLAYSGQRQIHVLLAGAWKRAIGDGALRENPTLHARPVSPSKTARPDGEEEARPAARLKHFTPEELARFIEAAKRERESLPLAFVGMTGLRIGEALALTWGDVQEDAGHVFVQVSKTRSEIGSEYKTTRPKTASSVRRVYLSPDAVRIVEEMRDRVRLESGHVGRYRGRGLREDAPIFPAVDGRHMRQDVARAVMRRTCAAAGVPLLSPHALRHSAGTYLISRGADPVTVAAMLGHAQVSTTLNIYAHALPDKVRGLAYGLDDLRPPAKADAAGQVEDREEVGTGEGKAGRASSPLRRKVRKGGPRRAG